MHDLASRLRCSLCSSSGKRPPVELLQLARRAEYKAALDFAIARGWLELHRSGTYVKFTPTGAELFS
jgi:hypothetical protein